MFRTKKSFFERLTGMMNTPDEEDAVDEEIVENEEEGGKNFLGDNAEDAQLTVDLYQSPSEIILQTIVAGVKPEDLEISINREMITIKGKRERLHTVSGDDFFFQELFWGSFSRTIVLPEEVDVDAAEAHEQNGLLTIRLPKIDRKKIQQLRVRTAR